MKLIFITTNKTTAENTFKFLFFSDFWNGEGTNVLLRKEPLQELACQTRTSCICLCRSQGTSPAGWALSGPADTEPLAARCQKDVSQLENVAECSRWAVQTLPRWCHCRWCRICPWSSWYVPRSSWRISLSPTVWGNLKLDGRGLRCCSSQPAHRCMHLVKPKHLPLACLKLHQQRFKDRMIYQAWNWCRGERGISLSSHWMCHHSLATTSHNKAKAHSCMRCHSTSKYFSEPVSVNSFTK